MITSRVESSICERQAEIFVLSGKKNINSEIFIDFYLKSDVAAEMDKPFHHFQWAGAPYVFEDLTWEYNGDFPRGKIWNQEALYWTGYITRYWHFIKNVSSREIADIADAKFLGGVYAGYHTLGIEQAIDRILENRPIKYRQSFPTVPAS